jgi:hypothetical protein
VALGGGVDSAECFFYTTHMSLSERAIQAKKLNKVTKFLSLTEKSQVTND